MSAKIKPYNQQVDIQLVFYRRNRRTDRDNIYAGAKFILDGLVKAGVLANDGWTEIRDIGYASKVSSVPCTHVYIMEV